VTTTRSGIPTLYAGVWFRSRLEAKWAALFDLVGWSWVYEPIDAPGYIPDFLIEGSRPVLVEVGDCATLAEYRDKSAKGDATAAVLARDLLVVGTSPLVPFSSLCAGASENPTVGWFGELDGGRFDWDAGLWGQCHECGAYGIVHSAMSYSLRPCGHHQSGSFGIPVPVDWIRALWRRAGNDTQWAACGPQSVGAIVRALR